MCGRVAVSDVATVPTSSFTWNVPYSGGRDLCD